MEITVEELNKLLDEQWKRGFEAGKVHTAKETFVENGKLIASGKLNGHAFVDLGLPSGTLWATCNVGANSPEVFGDYFAWGETKPKIEYIEENYNYASNPEVLPANNDAATINWGEGWRMPTREEFVELECKCTCKWTELNGKEGCLFIGPNGNYIFLPAAQDRSGDSKSYSGTYGFYWTSSLNSDSQFSRSWLFDFDKEGYGMNSDEFRSEGLSVRPVCSAQI